MELKEALQELKKSKERKFEQSIDLIINLKGVDLKRTNVSGIFSVQHKIKEKKICAFLTKKSSLIPTITQPEFQKYKDKKELRKLVNEFDFFISVASLMPQVASTFGKALGPAGKMPSPQLGIITQESDASIHEVLKKISTSVKIRAKEPSIKISIAKSGMSDEQIISNVETAFKEIVNLLPTKRENVRSVMIKYTMSKPIKLEIK